MSLRTRLNLLAFSTAGFVYEVGGRPASQVLREVERIEPASVRLLALCDLAESMWPQHYARMGESAEYALSIEQVRRWRAETEMEMR